MILRCRDHLGVAVDRPPTRREHDAARPRIDRCAKDVDGTDDIDVGIVEGVAHRFADVDLRGGVKDHIGTCAGERGRKLRHGDVELDERRARIDLLAPAPGQIVDHGHSVAGVDECVGDVGPDKAGAPGDERSHPWGATRCARGTCTWVTMKITNPMTTRLP